MTLTDQQLEREFEQAYATLVSTSPIPLDWEEASTRPVPLSQHPKATLWRYPVFVFASAALLVVVAVAVTVVALRPTSRVLEPGGADQWRAVVFLADDTTQDQIDGIAETLQEVDGVSTWVYVDKKMAFDEALALFAEDERLLATIREDPSILPATLRFSTVDEASARAVVRMAAQLSDEGETAIVDGAVSQGKLIANGPQDGSEQTPIQATS